MMPGAAGRLAALGILSRLGIALAATRLLAKLPYDLSPSDPLTSTLVALLLGALVRLTGLLAGAARRAACSDPLEALRYE
jgi:ABC-type lipoprotein release transport system permease subunit